MALWLSALGRKKETSYLHVCVWLEAGGLPLRIKMYQCRPWRLVRHSCVIGLRFCLAPPSSVPTPCSLHNEHWNSVPPHVSSVILLYLSRGHYNSELPFMYIRLSLGWWHYSPKLTDRKKIGFMNRFVPQTGISLIYTDISTLFENSTHRLDGGLCMMFKTKLNFIL